MQFCCHLINSSTQGSYSRHDLFWRMMQIGTQFILSTLLLYCCIKRSCTKNVSCQRTWFLIDKTRIRDRKDPSNHFISATKDNILSSKSASMPYYFPLLHHAVSCSQVKETGDTKKRYKMWKFYLEASTKTIALWRNVNHYPTENNFICCPTYSW